MEYLGDVYSNLPLPRQCQRPRNLSHCNFAAFDFAFSSQTVDVGGFMPKGDDLHAHTANLFPHCDAAVDS